MPRYKLNRSLEDNTVTDGCDQVCLMVQTIFAMAYDNVDSLISHFASSAIAFFRYLEVNGLSLLPCLETCDLSVIPMLKERLSEDDMATLNRKLEDIFLCYPGDAHQARLERAQYLRSVLESQADSPKVGLLLRLWPKLRCVATSVAGPFSVYEAQVRYYCNVPIFAPGKIDCAPAIWL